MVYRLPSATCHCPNVPVAAATAATISTAAAAAAGIVAAAAVAAAASGSAAATIVAAATGCNRPSHARPAAATAAAASFSGSSLVLLPKLGLLLLHNALLDRDVALRNHLPQLLRNRLLHALRKYALCLARLQLHGRQYSGLHADLHMHAKCEQESEDGVWGDKRADAGGSSK